MKFQVKATDPTKAEADVLVAFAQAGKTPEDVIFTEELKKIDRVLGGEISEVAAAEKYEAAAGSTMLLTTQGAIPSRRVLVVGVGKLSDLTMAVWQEIGAAAARSAKSVKPLRVSVAIGGDILDVFGAQKTAQGLVEGFTLGAYTFLKHKNDVEKKKNVAIDEVQLLVSPFKLNAVVLGSQMGEVVSGGVMLARDLVNEPPSLCTPTYMADVAKSLAKNHSDISCEVFGREDMKKFGMGGLLGIARGSDEEPKFIVLTYKGGGRKTIALVGKGITFDTGGLSLKPPQSMETMKIDMGGAAAVLGVFSALPELKPHVHVVGLLCVTENMVSGNSVKPGDVVRIMNGKTVEILNTDAEGRMVLCDGISYAAEKVKPDTIVDIATLTGACEVALGEDIAGLFVNDATLSKNLKDAAQSSGERIWELPLVKEYKDRLKSMVADLRNISVSKYGGAINGALFLQEFVPDGTPWAHLDIAGTAYAEKDAPLTPVGGTGFGVRLLLNYLLSL